MRRFVVLLAGVIGACTVPPAVPLRPDVQPLGRQWVYRVADHQGHDIGRIESRIIRAEGNQVVQETRETLNGETTTRRATATFQADGSLLVDEGDGHVTPLPSVRRVLIPGARWQNSDGTQVMVEGQEKVLVPAGTYFAYKLSLTKDTNKTTDWYFPSVGLIKEETSAALVELVSVSEGGPSPVPASDTMPSPGQ